MPLSKAFSPQVLIIRCWEVNNIGLWFAVGRFEVRACVGVWIWNAGKEHACSLHIPWGEECGKNIIVLTSASFTPTYSVAVVFALMWNEMLYSCCGLCQSVKHLLTTWYPKLWNELPARAKPRTQPAAAEPRHTVIWSRDWLHFHSDSQKVSWIAQNVHHTLGKIWNTTNKVLSLISRISTSNISQYPGKWYFVYLSMYVYIY